MYAVIESGGKQYKVEEGTSLLVDRLDVKEGDKVALRPVMFRDDRRDRRLAKELEKVKVEANVAEHLRGPKIKVFKYKAKKGYRRRAGHRSELTRLEVTSLKGAKAAAKKADARKPAAKATERTPMAHKKGLGSSRNGRESNPKMLGVKVFAGQQVTGGEIIVRQRGTRFWPGEGTGLGRDHTIFATRAGKVDFKPGPQGPHDLASSPRTREGTPVSLSIERRSSPASICRACGGLAPLVLCALLATAVGRRRQNSSTGTTTAPQPDERGVRQHRWQRRWRCSTSAPVELDTPEGMALRHGHQQDSTSRAENKTDQIVAINVDGGGASPLLGPGCADRNPPRE